jgi:hypothetical protein
MGLVSQRLRESAKGQPCMFRLSYCCNHDPATTVLCHAPSEIKGTGNKSHDFHAAFGCSQCHEAMDQRRLAAWPWENAWRLALMRTWEWWVENGYIKIVGDDEKLARRAKPLNKIVPRRGIGG